MTDSWIACRDAASSTQSGAADGSDAAARRVAMRRADAAAGFHPISTRARHRWRTDLFVTQRVPGLRHELFWRAIATGALLSLGVIELASTAALSCLLAVLAPEISIVAPSLFFPSSGVPPSLYYRPPASSPLHLIFPTPWDFFFIFSFPNNLWAALGWRICRILFVLAGLRGGGPTRSSELWKLVVHRAPAAMLDV